MKNLLVAGSILLFAVSAQAQKAGAPKKTATKPAASSSVVCRNESDSLSYAIGLSVANFYRQQGMANLNPKMVAQAITDVMNKRKTVLSEDQANLALMSHSNPQLGHNVKTGESFLAKNKKNPNVKTTASGLQYEVITAGTGVRPAATDTVTVHYKGTLLDGTEFDNSYKRGQPTTFPLNQVIKGWTEGLQLMAAGARYKFYIPYTLSYGLNDNGPIPGGSVLVFEVELLGVSPQK